MTENRHPGALAAAVSALTLALGVSGADGKTLPPAFDGKPAATKTSPPTATVLKPGVATPGAASNRNWSYDDESPKRHSYQAPGRSAAAPTKAAPPAPARATKADESPKETRYRLPASPASRPAKP